MVEQNREIEDLRRAIGEPKPLPAEIRRIALVTSEDREGEGPGDFFTELPRFVLDEIEIERVPVKVTDVDSVVEGIRRAADLNVDVVVVMRGGGSPLDLGGRGGRGGGLRG